MAVERGSDVKMEMWSEFIDEVWHTVEAQPGYTDFCVAACGQKIIHSHEKGYSKISWTGHYEEKYEPLPAVWFLDRSGRLKDHLYERYFSDGVIWASWDCIPEYDDDYLTPPKKTNTEVTRPRREKNGTTPPPNPEKKK